VLNDGGLLMNERQLKQLAMALGFEVDSSVPELDYLSEEEVLEAEMEDFAEIFQPQGGSFCHMPHHGFIFYDKIGKVLGRVEVCFLCSSVRASLEGMPDEYRNFRMLRELVRDLQLPLYKSNFEYTVLFRERFQGAGSLYYLPEVIYGGAEVLDLPLLFRNLSVRE
jgi:hypothetical protein